MSAVRESETRNSDRTENFQVVDKEYVHDSIYIYVKGDTVRETRWRILWKERIVHDTVVETDTIFLTKMVEKEVKVPAEGGKAGWGAAAALFGIIVIYILIKTFKNKH